MTQHGLAIGFVIGFAVVLVAEIINIVLEARAGRLP